MGPGAPARGPVFAGVSANSRGDAHRAIAHLEAVVGATQGLPDHYQAKYVPGAYPAVTLSVKITDAIMSCAIMSWTPCPSERLWSWTLVWILAVPDCRALTPCTSTCLAPVILRAVSAPGRLLTPGARAL